MRKHCLRPFWLRLPYIRVKGSSENDKKVPACSARRLRADVAGEGSGCQQSLRNPPHFDVLKAGEAVYHAHFWCQDSGSRLRVSAKTVSPRGCSFPLVVAGSLALCWCDFSKRWGSFRFGFSCILDTLAFVQFFGRAVTRTVALGLRTICTQ